MEKNIRKPFLTEIKNVILPNALLMGVDHDTFWTMTMESLDPYFKAFSIQQKRIDQQAWLNGMYIKMAIASSFDNDAKYPQRSMMDQQELESDKELLAQRQMEAIKQTMMERMIVVNQRIRQEGGQ